MNVGEAGAVARVLDFVTGLTLFEHLDDRYDAEQLVRDGRFLAERIRKALAAGPMPDQVEEALRFLLDTAGELAEPDERPVDDVPVTGGRL